MLTPVSLGYNGVVLVGLVLWGFRAVGREGNVPRGPEYGIPRHLLSILARGLGMALIGVVPTLGVWALLDETMRGAAFLRGAGVLVGFALLATGVLSVAIRLALAAAASAHGPRLLPSIRPGAILAGVVYGLALYRFTSPEPVEILVSLHLMGAALVVLGLNRSGTLEPDRLARLAKLLRNRRPGKR